MATSYTNWT